MCHEELISVTRGTATYGVVVREGRVVRAAPVAAWMIGKPWSRCEDWLKRKGATINTLRG